MRYIARIDKDEHVIDINESGEVTLDGTVIDADLEPSLDPTLYSLIVHHRSYDLRVAPGEGCYKVLIEGRTYEVVIEDEQTRRLAGVRSSLGSGGAEKIIKAPMPGVVIVVPVKQGQAVAKGQTLVVLESMKMHNEFKAPVDGTVHAVRVAAGDRIDQNEIMVTLA